MPGPGYTLSKASLTKTAFTATLTPTAPPPPGTTGELALTLTPFAGAVRVHITEAAPAAAAARYEVPGVLPADLTSAWGGAWGPGSAVAKQPGGRTLLALPASAGPGWVVVEAAPFALSLHLGPTPPAPGAAPAIAFNGGGFLDVQPLRNLGGNAGGGGGPAENETWAETWKGHTDERKAGPQAVALDLTFPAGATLYGLPERAAPAALRPTAGPDPANATASVDAEPYRLYNLDVFEYEADSNFGLYGSIPAVIAHSPGGGGGEGGAEAAAAGSKGAGAAGTPSPPPPPPPGPATVGALWLNAAEMWVDLLRPAGPAGPAATRGVDRKSGG